MGFLGKKQRCYLQVRFIAFKEKMKNHMVGDEKIKKYTIVLISRWVLGCLIRLAISLVSVYITMFRCR